MSDTLKGFLIFAITLLVAEFTMIIDANLNGLQEIDFAMICRMVVLGGTQTLAWLTLSPKEQPFGRSPENMSFTGTGKG